MNNKKKKISNVSAYGRLRLKLMILTKYKSIPNRKSKFLKKKRNQNSISKFVQLRNYFSQNSFNYRDEFLIASAIASNDFLNNVIGADQVNLVAESMYLKELKASEVIIEEGDDGDFMCISAGGSFEVIVKGETINTFSNYRVFGEHAILYNAKRNATIKCTTDCRVWVIDRNDFKRIIIQNVLKEQDEFHVFLKNVPILNGANAKKLKKVSNLLRKQFFKTDEVIVREGDAGDKFYIIRAGSVKVEKEGEGIVANLTRGQYFGELALLKEDKRQATVIAEAPGVECLTLQRNEFVEHLGNIGDFIKEPLPKVSSKKKSESGGEFLDIDLEQLTHVATLGLGGFGRVELVKHKEKSDLVFALKYLKKIEMVQQEQQLHAYNEKLIQTACNTTFIVRMYKTFRDCKYVYFLMECCLGGDLWQLLQKQKNRRFEEAAARFYAACVLEAISYLHERNIIYRDLKPENLMIDTRGYLKLTDFGFAKQLEPPDRTFTFAGTPEYVAPEIVMQKGHDKSVDYWEYGILIYELLVGRTPFRSNDPSNMKTYNLIMGGIEYVTFPNHVPRSAQHLVKKLCRAIPFERLGCQKNGTEDIRCHKWFVGFDWEHLRNQKMKAPFIPKLKSNVDTRYFDTFKKDIETPPDEMSGWDADF